MTIRIGSEYRPSKYEKRTTMEYQSLRPDPSDDAIRLQRALTRKHLHWIEGNAGDRLVGVGIGLILLALIAMSFAGWLS